MSELNIAGFVLSLLFIVLILTKKDKQISDYLLAVFVSLLGTYLLIKYAFENDLVTSYPIIVYLDIYYWTLLGPTLYVYTMVSTRGENHLRIQYLYTLIPAVLVTIFFYEYIFSNPLSLFYSETQPPTYVLIGVYIWLYNSPIFYILSILAIKKHQNSIKQHFSYTKSVDFKWLSYLTNGFAIFLFFLLSKGLIQNLFDIVIPIENYGFSIVVMVVYIFGIGIFGYKQSGIFDSAENTMTIEIDSEKNVAEELKNQKIYMKSGLNKDEAMIMLNKLLNLMETDKPYLESQLDLPTLAKMIDVSTHKLSQVINEYINKNFFDFINEYRIEKVKELLSDSNNNQFKIISLAYESGFNSKSTFYNLFKKLEGITPAEYKHNTQKKAG